VSRPTVELVAVTKRYGDVVAVDNVSLAIQPGELVAILGPNGAGKTTAINLMLGLRNPSSGKAHLFGIDPKDLRARSRIGVMLQESGVPGMLRVEELVGLFCSYYPRPLPAAGAIALAGLEEKARTLVKRPVWRTAPTPLPRAALCGDPEVLSSTSHRRHGRRGPPALLREIADLGARGRTIGHHPLEEADQLAQRIVVIDPDT
jgi:ABC-2 type transport system ATP-binding protein